MTGRAAGLGLPSSGERGRRAVVHGTGQARGCRAGPCRPLGGEKLFPERCGALWCGHRLFQPWLHHLAAAWTRAGCDPSLSLHTWKDLKGQEAAGPGGPVSGSPGNAPRASPVHSPQGRPVCVSNTIRQWACCPEGRPCRSAGSRLRWRCHRQGSGSKAGREEPRSETDRGGGAGSPS